MSKIIQTSSGPDRDFQYIKQMNLINRMSFERWTFASFIILAFFGAILRYMLCFPLPGFSYMNILHAHSHYAFGGWVFLALMILIMRQIPQYRTTTFKWLMFIALISSLGMLISFSIQGYKAVSIAFSTLFLLVTYWFAAFAYPKLKFKDDQNSSLLIKAGIWCLVLSSIGPLALGVLKATGNTGAIYQNAIYFYLHFQMNGWMLLATLGLVFKSYLRFSHAESKSIRRWLYAFILSGFPLFFIFTLWSKPSAWVTEIAFISALINAVSWFVIIEKSFSTLKNAPLMIQTALLAVSLKVFFQVLVCVPQIGEWTFSNRNLIIGYVHLLTLGCVTPVLLHLFTSHLNLKYIERSYIALVALYLVLLFIQPVLSLYRIAIPDYQHLLLCISLLFCLSGFCYYVKLFPFPKLKNFNKQQFQTFLTKPMQL